MSFSTPQSVYDLAITVGLNEAYRRVEASHGNGGGAPMTDEERAKMAFGPEDVLEARGSKNSGGMYETAVARDIARTVRRTELVPKPDFDSAQAPQPLPAAVVMPSVVEIALPSQVA
jgi:hypothetical protein